MSGGKVVENEEEAWASFNPFLQDSIKHTEILERLAADADAFYYATSSDEDSNDQLLQPDSTTFTEKKDDSDLEDDIQMIKHSIVPLSLQKTQLTLHYQNEIEKVSCFPKTTPSLRVPLESVSSVLFHVQSSDKQRDTFLFSPTNPIMNFLQQISDPICVTDTDKASRYLVQAVNTDSSSSFTAQLSVFQINSAVPNGVSSEIVWECPLPLNHIVTHVAILNTTRFSQTKVKSSSVLHHSSLPSLNTHMTLDMVNAEGLIDRKQTLQMTQELSNTKSPLLYSNASQNDQQEEKLSSLEKTASHESDETMELQRHKTVPWLVVVISTIVEKGEKCHTITTESPSYLSIFCITTGLTYLKTIPLKYGLVFDILFNSKLKQCFQPNHVPFINSSNATNPFGLLTYSARLYIIENISVNPKNDLNNPLIKTYTTTRFQQKCINLHGLVSHHQIGVKYVKLFQTPSKSIRVCVFFSNGVAYCYDEYNMAHRLDTLDFPPSDVSCTLQHPPFTPFDLSISLVKDTTTACFDSVASLQEESWRHHLLHKQKTTKEPFETSSMTLANILVDCLQKSSLMESLGITDPSFSVHHLPLQHLCFTNTTTKQDSLESPALQTLKLLTCFSLDHLCHQVTASVLLASKDEYLYWIMLLCIFCVVNEKDKILYTLFNSCLTSMYEECKNTIFKKTFHELRNPLKSHPSFHPFSCNQHSFNSCDDSSTWSILGSCTMQKYSLQPLQEDKESYDNFIFLYWMNSKILYDMNLSAFSLFFEYILKTLLPSSAWKHFTLNDMQHVIFPCYSLSKKQDVFTSQADLEETQEFDPFYHVVCNVLKKSDKTAVPSLVNKNQLQKLIHLFENMKQKIRKLQDPTTNFEKHNNSVEID